MMEPLSGRQFWAFWIGLLIAGDGLLFWIMWQKQPNLIWMGAGILLLTLGIVLIEYSTALETEPT